MFKHIMLAIVILMMVGCNLNDETVSVNINLDEAANTQAIDVLYISVYENSTLTTKVASSEISLATNVGTVNTTINVPSGDGYVFLVSNAKNYVYNPTGNLFYCGISTPTNINLESTTVSISVANTFLIPNLYSSAGYFEIHTNLQDDLTGFKEIMNTNKKIYYTLSSVNIEWIEVVSNINLVMDGYYYNITKDIIPSQVKICLGDVCTLSAQPVIP